MKKMKCSHLGKKMATLAIALVMILSCSFSAMAAPRSTGVYLGAGVANLGDGIVNYQVNGHIYYNTNTSTQLSLASMVQWIYNYGSQKIDEVRFEALSGTGFGNAIGYYEINPITAGNNARIEENWAARYGNAVYLKNGIDQAAFTSMSTGYDGGVYYSAWNSTWYSTTRDDQFYFGS